VTTGWVVQAAPLAPPPGGVVNAKWLLMAQLTAMLPAQPAYEVEPLLVLACPPSPLSSVVPFAVLSPQALLVVVEEVKEMPVPPSLVVAQDDAAPPPPALDATPLQPAEPPPPPPAQPPPPPPPPEK
jgi:hypothetical protein